MRLQLLLLCVCLELQSDLPVSTAISATMMKIYSGTDVGHLGCNAIFIPEDGCSMFLRNVGI
jgi:hypothetical protein